MSIEIVGLLEYQSIADGYFALDAMVKQAPVEILRAETINPGKFLIIICGDVASVESAMNEAYGAGEDSIYDRAVLRNLDDSVLGCIQQVKEPEDWDALGLIETTSIVSAIEAADTAVKAAGVEIVEINAGNETGGKSLLKLNGPVGDMEYAVETACAVLRGKDRLFRSVVIPVPHIDIKGYVSGN